MPLASVSLEPDAADRLGLGGRGEVDDLTGAVEPAAAPCRRRREALGGAVGERQQLARQLPRVLDDPQALGPDPVGVGVQLLDAVLGRGGDLRGLVARELEPVLGLAARLAGDLLDGLVRPLEDARDLLPTRSSARRTAASGERVACSSATSWLVLLT